MSTLKPENFNVSKQIAHAETLPSEAFRDPQILAQELETVFKTSWLLAEDSHSNNQRNDHCSPIEHVQETNAYAPLELCGSPLYLHRSPEGNLRCFPNVCTHAWYPLVSEPGCGKAVTCGQHGRRMDCKGQFLSQPSFAGMENFPRECDHLKEVPFHEWNKLGFACLGQPRHDFEHVFEPINASLAHMPLHQLERVVRQDEVRVVDGNWKQHAWNFMDKFHIPFIHRGPNGLVDLLDYRTYQTELYDHASLQWAWAKNPDYGFDPDHLPERFRDTSGKGRRVIALWWFVFPNLTLNFYPWGLSINLYEPLNDDPTKTKFVWQHYVMDEKKYQDCESVWQNTKVDNEDVLAMNLVRKGIQSGFAPRGRFAPEEEAGPHWFHRTVFEHLFSEFEV